MVGMGKAFGCLCFCVGTVLMLIEPVTVDQHTNHFVVNPI